MNYSVKVRKKIQEKNMTQEEKENEIESLTKAKKGYDLNRSICAGVILIVGYMAFGNDGIHTTPLFFLLLLGFIMLAVAGVLIYDCFVIKGINKKIKDLNDGTN